MSNYIYPLYLNITAIFNWQLFCICPDIILRLNRTAQNETNVTDEDLGRKIAEVESMLREMRFRGFDFQMRLAENELEQANKCEWQDRLSL